MTKCPLKLSKFERVSDTRFIEHTVVEFQDCIGEACAWWISLEDEHAAMCGCCVNVLAESLWRLKLSLR